MHINLDNLVPIAFFGFVFLIIKTISNNRLRKRLIDSGQVGEQAKHLFPKEYQNYNNSLKWGLVIAAVGLGILIGNSLPLHEDDKAVYTIALMLLLAGTAFIIFYFIDRKGGDNSIHMHDSDDETNGRDAT